MKPPANGGLFTLATKKVCARIIENFLKSPFPLWDILKDKPCTHRAGLRTNKRGA